MDEAITLTSALETILYRIMKIFKKLARGIVVNGYKLADQILHRMIYAHIHKKIVTFPSSMQIFLIARHDFGALICNLHYAALWQRERGDVALVILTQHLDFTLSLARAHCPDVPIVTYEKSLPRFLSFVFKNRHCYNITFNHVYSLVLMEKINAIMLWDNQPCSLGLNFVGSYIEAFDKALPYAKKRGTDFYQAYLYFRRHYFVRLENWKDYNQLLIEKEPLKPSEQTRKALQGLLREFSVDRPYVILHLSGFISGYEVADRRRIHDPSRFDPLIDRLIEKGYAVILHGRKEQPHFSKREHFIDYAHSEWVSPENDLALYSKGEFVIASKTGPETFCQLFDIPLLGVNYSEHPTMLHPIRYRYFNKHIRDSSGKYLSWKGILSHPIFFEFGVTSIEKDHENYQFEEMSEKELLESLEEFLSLLSKPTREWLNYSDLQKSFKEELDPSHFDVYTCSSVPCDTYLSSKRTGARDALAMIEI